MKKRIVIVLLLAMLGWFVPINKTVAKSDNQLVFVIDEELSKPKQILGPSPQEFAKATIVSKPKRVGSYEKKSLEKNKVSYCSCVSYAKSQTGFNQSVGNAKNWPVNSSVPTIGAVVITYESGRGHVAVIKDIIDGYLILKEANYSSCKFTDGRKLAINSTLIKGYWVAI